MGFVRATELAIAENEVAVAVQRGYFGSHVGIVFNSAKDGRQIVHLRFHKDLAVEGFPNDKCWVAAKSQIPPMASKQLTGIIRSIAKKQPEIPYGLNLVAAKGSFAANGAYKPPKGSDGLTCATFVSEVYRISSIPLLNESTWPVNDENKDWGTKVLALLAQKGADADHLRRVERSISGLRIRPEEVAAAAEKPKKPPYVYEVAKDLGKAIMRFVEQACPENRPAPLPSVMSLLGNTMPASGAAMPFNLLMNPQKK